MRSSDRILTTHVGSLPRPCCTGEITIKDRAPMKAGGAGPYPAAMK